MFGKKTTAAHTRNNNNRSNEQYSEESGYDSYVESGQYGNTNSGKYKNNANSKSTNANAGATTATASKRIAPIRLTFSVVLITAVAFALTGIVFLSPFSTSAAKSIGFVSITSDSTSPKDGISSAILTVWGYCITASANSIVTCYPATSLLALGEDASDFQFNPTPPTFKNISLWTVNDTLAALPYKANPLLIFALPVSMVLLGLAFISSLFGLLTFFLRSWSSAWVACAKFTSTLTLIAWIVLLICAAGAGVAASGLLTFIAAVPTVSGSQSAAGITLIVTAIVAVTAAFALSTWSFYLATAYNKYLLLEKEAARYPMEEFGDEERGNGGYETQRRGSNSDVAEDAWRYDDSQVEQLRSPPNARRRGDDNGENNNYNSRGTRSDGRNASNGEENKRNKSRNDGGDTRGGGGGRSRGNDRQIKQEQRRSVFNRYSNYGNDGDFDDNSNIGGGVGGDNKITKNDAGGNVSTTDAAKSDWGILRTAKGVAGGAINVAGGVYGYFAGSSTPTDPTTANGKTTAKKDMDDPKKTRNAIANASSRRRSPVRGQSSSRRDDRDSRPNNRSSSRGGGGGSSRRPSPDRKRR
ncbi:hypothetical protein HK100_010964 [Physocladia obscura]|uniref:Uncharacterized protein n=1 Tax=Physocladia obscura TaxID=109957 RepID=A0AAD5XDK6_9FUNG|nr:hypothetical protein HK100_010964 [Physocladia obscura]